MIDFRYHIVSLISVFLALAVGIVLGAGPLQQSLGSQLANQVEQLRSEKDQLRTQNDQLSQRSDQMSSYIAATAPQLLRGRMNGASTAVIVDDSSLAPTAATTTGLLTGAGTSSVTRVTLGSALWDPAKADVRTDAVSRLGSAAPGLTLEGDDDAAKLGDALVQLLAAPLPPQQRTAGLSVLEKAGIASFDGATNRRLESVLVLSSTPGTLAVGADTPQVASERAQEIAAAQSAMARRLVAGRTPAVVAGATPSSDDSKGLIRIVRGDAALQAISTVDGLQRADGPPTAVLALVEQRLGGHGAYGTAPGAAARVPVLNSPASDGGRG